MKKFALSLLIATAATFGTGAAVSAQYDTTIPTTSDATGGLPTTTVAATVPGGGLPATGSNGVAPTTGIAVGLLVVGLGLFVVTRVRRGAPGAA